MSRNRDPLDEFFRDDDMGSIFDHFDRLFDSMTGQHRRGDPYNPRDPFDGFFGGFFPPPFGGRGPPRNPRDPRPRGGGGGGPRAEESVPDLSLINPNAAPPSKQAEYYNDQRAVRPHHDDVWTDIRDMFGPAFGDVLKPDREPRLGDINPDVYNDEHAPISRDDNNSSSFGLPPGFRSPYLPNDTGEENEIPQSYFRTYSSVTYTNENGQSETRTTIRDESGERTTVTKRGPDGETYEEDYDGDLNNVPPNIMAPPSDTDHHPFGNRGLLGRNFFDDGQDDFEFQRRRGQNNWFDRGDRNRVVVHDPLGSYRGKARDLYWKYWPLAGVWRSRSDENTMTSPDKRSSPTTGRVEWRSVDEESPAAWLNKIRKDPE